MKIPVLLSALLSPAILSAETAVFTPVKDSDVYSFLSRPTSSTFDLGVNNSPEGQGSHSQKSLVQFDISTLAIPGTEISSARLCLFVLTPGSTEGGGFRAGDLAVYKQAGAWGPITATYPNWNTIQPSGEAVTIHHVAASGEWIELDVTSAVHSWTSGAEANHGFILQCVNDPAPAGETTNLLFASMELGQAAVDNGLPENQWYFPQLLITRATPPPILSIARDSGDILLTWPAATSEGWALQQADSPAGPWEEPEISPTQASGVWQLRHPLSVAPRAFFRLRRD